MWRLYLFIYLLPYVLYFLCVTQFLTLPNPQPATVRIMFCPCALSCTATCGFPPSASCSVLSTPAVTTPWHIRYWNCIYVVWNSSVLTPKRNIAYPLQTRGAQIFQRSGSDYQILGARRVSQAIRQHPAAFIGVGDLARESVPSRGRPVLQLCVWRQSLWCDSHKPLVAMNHNCMPLAQWRAFFRSRLTFMHLYRAYLLWRFSAYSCRAEGHNTTDAIL